MEKQSIYRDEHRWVSFGGNPKVVLSPIAFSDDADLIMMHLNRICGRMISDIEKHNPSSLTVTFDCLYDLLALNLLVRDVLEKLHNKPNSIVVIGIKNILGLETQVLKFQRNWPTKDRINP